MPFVTIQIQENYVLFHITFLKIQGIILLLAIFLQTVCGLDFGLPSDSDLLLEKQGFSVGYSHAFRQPVWVAYTLSAKNLQSRQVRRKNVFKADPAIKHNPVHPGDYAGSGYDKGHLAPAADMTYSMVTMDNSFLMSNISPQLPGCNRGVWKRLENQIRQWAIQEKQLYVITGPIFSSSPATMKETAIPVPIAFYKVIYDLTPPHKMIGFIVPNAGSKARVASFAVSVDEVERITGYNFFSELPPRRERRLERQSDFSAWGTGASGNKELSQKNINK